MTSRPHWRRATRQGLARLARLSGVRGNEINSGLYVAHRNRLLRSIEVIASATADLVGHDMADEDIWRLAGMVDLFASYDECVPWYRKAKRSSGWRTICVPPLSLKVRQRVITQIITAQQSPHPSIFNWKGRGCSQQAYRIKETIENQGRYILIADIRDCYPSVRMDAMYDLGLVPPEVLRFASDSRHLHLNEAFGPRVDGSRRNHHHHTTQQEQTGPHGLLQGLGSSDALWVSLVSDLPERLQVHGAPFIYCDNIAVVCATLDDAAAAQQTLVRYFSDHRAGPFSLTVSIHDACERFEHTGYAFRLCATTGQVSITPSVANHIKLTWRLERDVRRFQRNASTSQARQVFDDHTSGFSAITDDYREEMLSSFIAEIEARRPVDVKAMTGREGRWDR